MNSVQLAKVSDNLIELTGCQSKCRYVQVGITVGGTVIFTICALASGFLHGPPLLTIACGGGALFLGTVQVIDWTCGQGSVITRIFDKAVKSYASLQGNQTILLEKLGIDKTEMQSLLVQNGNVIVEIKAVNQTSAEDRAKWTATIQGLETKVTNLEGLNNKLTLQVNAQSDENLQLKTQVSLFGKQLELYKAEIGKAGALIPAMQNLDHAMDETTADFQRKSKETLSTFSHDIAQLESHSELLDTLKKRNDELQAELQKISHELEQSKATNGKLQNENKQMHKAAESVGQMHLELQALETHLKQEKADLAERRNLLEQEKRNHEQLSKELQRTSDIVTVHSTDHYQQQIELLQRIQANDQ